MSVEQKYPVFSSRNSDFQLVGYWGFDNKSFVPSYHFVRSDSKRKLPVTSNNQSCNTYVPT